jgi:hypothetical protein
MNPPPSNPTAASAIVAIGWRARHLSAVRRSWKQTLKRLSRPLKMDAPSASVDTFFFKYISEPNETGFEKQASIVKNAIVMRD